MTKSMLENNLFQHEVVNTTRVFGRDHKIEVLFDGDQAMTDKSTVVLPSLGEETLNERDQRIMRGYVDHEAGHIRYTQMELMTSAGDEHPALGALLNGCEDVRIDKLTCEQYPGAAKNIRETAEAATDIYLRSIKEDPSLAQAEQKIAPLAITWAGRKLSGLSGTKVDECLDTLTPEFRAKVEAWAAASVAAQSTSDVLNVARQVFQDLQYPPADPPPPPPPKGGSGQGDGQGKGDGGGPSGGGAMDPGMKQAVQAVAEKSKGDDKAAVKPALASTGSTDWVDFDTVKSGYGSNLKSRKKSYENEYQNVLANELAGAVGVMSKTFQRVLASTMMRNRERNLEAGRLDSKRLVQAYVGRPNVFWMPAERVELDTYVHALVDMSSSMSGHEARTARMSLVAVGETLERIGIPWGATTFHGDNMAVNKMQRELPRWKRILDKENPTWRKDVGDPDRAEDVYSYAMHCGVFARYGGELTLGILKRAEERVRDARWRLGAMTVMPSGGTPTKEALKELWPLIHKRTERRRVVMLLTDGAPNDLPGSVQAISEYEERGVPVVCIGMGTDVVKRMTKVGRFAVVKDAASLTGSMLDELQKVMQIAANRRAA